MDGIRKMRCMSCEKKWDALCYEETQELECPNCGAMNKVFNPELVLAVKILRISRMVQEENLKCATDQKATEKYKPIIESCRLAIKILESTAV